MNKLTPIIRTRVPADLQQVFIKANRGEVVDVPPKSLCRHWVKDRAHKESTKIKKSTSFHDLMETDYESNLSPLSTVLVPSRLSLYNECGDHYSDISSHCSTDDSTTYEHLEVLQRQPALFSRWDAEYSPKKRDKNLRPFRRQGSFRWEIKTVEGESGTPKMPSRH